MGVFGGQFDPPHTGHVAAVRAARVQAELREVIVIPDGTPPHRDSSVLPAGVRYRLAYAAFRDELAVTVSQMALLPDGPVYMVDKLVRLAEGRELVLIVGADQYARFDTWHDPDRIRELAEIAVAPRTGFPMPSGAELALDMPPVDTSSTELREAIARGEDVRDRIPPAAWGIMERERLYV